MRARNIKPGFFKNDELAEFEPLVRIFFTGLWCYADREGRLEMRPKKLKAEILPYDECDVENFIERLSSSDFLSKYSVDGKDYLQINNWHKHQNPHHMEPGSEIPPPPGSQNKFNDSPITASQRNRILNRDGRKCVICGSTKNLHVDHIIPRSKGGDSRDSNLQTLCRKCNLEKGASINRASSVQAPCTNLDETLIPDSGYRIPDSLIPEVNTLTGICPQEADDPDDPPEEKPKTPPCPHQEIIALYHEILPELREVKVWNATRKKLLAARWKENKARQNLDWWERYFNYVKKCPFLMGQVANRDGPPFEADLEWLVRPQNFAKVIEGKYERRN
jgi:hypothetical protein